MEDTNMIRRNLIPVWVGIILLSCMFLMGQETWPPPCEEVVDFPDPSLEQVIRSWINKPEGDICSRDLIRLKYLYVYATDASITDLSGLEYCTALHWIDLDENQISDLTPLAGLTNLQSLGLDFNQISDLTPLAGLTNLQSLGLDFNQISDLTPLAGLTDLFSLGLDYNQISDITPLVGLTGLIRLYLG
jgi:Leucine-rich repeat (LRR) protein